MEQRYTREELQELDWKIPIDLPSMYKLQQVVLHIDYISVKVNQFHMRKYVDFKLQPGNILQLDKAALCFDSVSRPQDSFNIQVKILIDIETFMTIYCCSPDRLVYFLVSPNPEERALAHLRVETLKEQTAYLEQIKRLIENKDS